MSKKILKPNKRIKRINLDEIEIKTLKNEILKEIIISFRFLVILIFGELYLIYRFKKINFYNILLCILILLFVGILGFILSNWEFKIYKKKIIIKYALKKYIIDINNLISLEVKDIPRAQTPGFATHSSGKCLNIIYEENQSLKEMNLLFNITYHYFFSITFVDINKIKHLIDSIEYEYISPILDGDSLNFNINKKEIFIVIMTILIGWTIINLVLYIMLKIFK